MSHFDYQPLYDKLREHGYHEEEDNTSHLAEFIPWIAANLNVASALDIGCSSGRSLELFQEHGIEASGVEISEIAVDVGRAKGRNVVQGCATNLPFEDESFDLVCSADVFEHLHPDDALAACKEACRVAGQYVFMRIAEKEDVTQEWKDLAGHPLHLTTNPIDWWKDLFKPYGELVCTNGPVFCLKIKGD